MSQLEIQINERYFELVPRPSKEEYESLKYSIMVEGQKDPIVINSKGVVLDGHTRYEICHDLGITPKTRIMDFEDEELYVIQSNTNRRQLNSFQKIEIYYKILKEYELQAKFNRQHWHDDCEKFPSGLATKRYAKLIGVPEKTVQRGKKLIEKATPYTLSKLRNGTLTITKAYSLLDNIHTKTRNNSSLMKFLDYCKKDPILYEQLVVMVECFRKELN